MKVQLKGTHAKQHGYEKFVGMEVEPTGKNYTESELTEVVTKADGVPFPISIAVHPDDIQNG